MSEENKNIYMDKIEITTEEENRIKSKAISSLPLNPSAQGWSGAQIRKRMASSITDGEDSLLHNIKKKFYYIKKLFESMFEDKVLNNWYYGDIIDSENLTISLDSVNADEKDFYLNTISGDVFACVEVDLDNAVGIWEYIYNIKDVIDHSLDSENIDIEHTLIDNLDKTYSATDINSISLIIPLSVNHGFCSGFNFKVSETIPSITFMNNAEYPLKILQFGLEITSYTPMQNKVVNMSFYCDGIYIYCYVNEV